MYHMLLLWEVHILQLFLIIEWYFFHLNFIFSTNSDPAQLYGCDETAQITER